MIFDDWAIPDTAAAMGTWLDRYFDTPVGGHDDLMPFAQRGADDGGFSVGPYAVIGHDFQGGSAVIVEALTSTGGFWNGADASTQSGSSAVFDDGATAAALPFMVEDTPFALGGRPTYAMRMLMDSFEGGSLSRIWN